MAVVDYAVNGAADGVTATTGNTGFTQVTPGTGGSISWRASAGRNGDTGLQFQVGTGANLIRETIVSDMRQRVSMWFKTPASAPATSAMLLAFRSTGYAVRLTYGNTGNLFVTNTASANTAWIAAGALAADTWYFIDIDVTVATSTTGVLLARVFDEYGTQVGSTYSQSNGNFGTTAINVLQVSGDTFAWTFGIYGVRTEEGAGSPIAPYGGFASNTVTATGTLTATGTATSSAGTPVVTATGSLIISGSAAVQVDKRAIFKALLTPSPSSSVRGATMGSSSTAGANATPSANRYVNRFGDLLRARFGAGGDTQALAGGAPTANGILLRNGGTGGVTSANYIDSTRLAYIVTLDPAFVTHMIGSNDRVNGVLPATYKANMQAAIDAIDAGVPHPVFHIVIGSFPRVDSGGTYPWSDYQQVIRELDDENLNVWTIDLAPTFQAIYGVPGADPLGLISGDGIHMDNAGHELMAQLLFGLTIGFTANGSATLAGAGTISAAEAATGTLSASTPGLTVGAVIASWAGTASAPGAFAGTIDAATPPVAVNVPTIAWAGAYTPASGASLVADTPLVTIAVPTLTWAGTASVPASPAAYIGDAPVALRLGDLAVSLA